MMNNIPIDFRTDAFAAQIALALEIKSALRQATTTLVQQQEEHPREEHKKK